MGLPVPVRIPELEAGCRCCRAMQALLPEGSGVQHCQYPTAGSMGGLIQKEELFPWATQSPVLGLGFCLCFWPQEPSTMSRVVRVTPCTSCSPRGELPNCSKPPVPPFSGIR